MSIVQTTVDHAFGTAVKKRQVPGIAAVALDRDGNVIFKGSYGSINVDDAAAAPVSSRTTMRIYSLTKLVTVVAALQLLEAGRFQLDDAVEDYVPSIRQVQVLEGFSNEGLPRLRPARTKPTIRQLMTHTAGFTYHFLDHDTHRYRKWFWAQRGKQAPETMDSEEYMFPIAFDPGTAYAYGISIEWLGRVIEVISQRTLDEYLRQHIFKPLGMDKTGNAHPADMWVHVARADGTVTSVGPAVADIDAHGGQYLNSSLDEYSTFLVTILNGGIHPKTKVRLLSEHTVTEYLFEDHAQRVLGRSSKPPPAKAGCIGVFYSADQRLTLDGDLLSGVRKGWSLGLMLAQEPVKYGRDAGSGSWAGLANLYFWLDPRAGRLGLVMTAMFPFLNREVLELCGRLESAVYEHGML